MSPAAEAPGRSAAGAPADRARVTLEEFERIFRQVSNWGKFAAAAGRGTLNYVTPDKVRAAAGLVRSGRTVSLALPQIAAMGMVCADSLQLEDLAAACASERRWEFMVVAAPLRIPGATGSLFNPIALF